MEIPQDIQTSDLGPIEVGRVMVMLIDLQIYVQAKR